MNGRLTDIIEEGMRNALHTLVPVEVKIETGKIWLE